MEVKGDAYELRRLENVLTVCLKSLEKLICSTYGKMLKSSGVLSYRRESEEKKENKTQQRARQPIYLPRPLPLAALAIREQDQWNGAYLPDRSSDAIR
jgi:hypothetical protein